jgi:hypothetical protein
LLLVPPGYGRNEYLGMARSGMAGPMEEQGFQEKSFFEYHLYTLPRRTDILSNQTQQITLFPTATDVSVETVMVYHGLPPAVRHWFFPDPRLDSNLGQPSNSKVDVYVRFRNEDASNLGMPLPRGKVRVYKQDAEATGGDGALEFIGEDLIDHTPRDERVLVKVGQAFDVVGERTQTNFTVNSAARQLTESFRIELRNHKEEPVDVIIREGLFRWVNWEIIEPSQPFEKIASRTIHFEVDVPPRGTKGVIYTVIYSW